MYLEYNEVKEAFGSVIDLLFVFSPLLLSCLRFMFGVVAKLKKKETTSEKKGDPSQVNI